MICTDVKPATVAVNQNSPLATIRSSRSVTNGMRLENPVNNDEPMIYNLVVECTLYEQSKTHLYELKS